MRTIALVILLLAQVALFGCAAPKAHQTEDAEQPIAEQEPEHQQEVPVPSTAAGDDENAQKLAEIEEKLRKTPDDPMLYYRKAEYLMELSRHNEGYEAARTAMKFFIKKNNDLIWMKLERVEVGDVLVNVHFNMGPDERTPPDNGIMRPLSFRVWNKDMSMLHEIIDFEIATSDGEPMTAAFGQMCRGGVHCLIHMMDTGADYDTIRKAALALIRKRYP